MVIIIYIYNNATVNYPTVRKINAPTVITVIVITVIVLGDTGKNFFPRRAANFSLKGSKNALSRAEKDLKKGCGKQKNGDG